MRFLVCFAIPDESDDLNSAKFAPTNDINPDNFTGPPLSPTSPRGPSVTDRISQRLREKMGDAKTTVANKASEVLSPVQDKGKGRADEPAMLATSPDPMSATFPANELANAPPPPPKAPEPIILGEIMMPPEAVSVLLIRAKQELPLRPVRLPIIGEYPDCFSGEEFVNWLKDNIKDIQGNLDKAEEAAIDLTETHNLLRRIGELGNQFVNSPEAFYQFRPKVVYSLLLS